MANEKVTTDESELHLEVMLYLLEDPVLDRTAFEERLADDPQLGEILAQGVAVFQNMKSIKTFVPSVSIADVSTNKIEIPPRHLWRTLATLAASLILIVFLGLRSYRSTLQPPTEIVSSHIENLALNNVVWAWGELQTDEPEDHLQSDFSDIEGEYTRAAIEPFSESDVPDWLVMATADSIESGYDQRDSKAFLQ